MIAAFVCSRHPTDPTPYLYNSALYAAAGVLSVATVANLMMRPVSAKYLMKEESSSSSSSSKATSTAAGAGDGKSESA